jgi:hypothetical protein
VAQSAQRSERFSARQSFLRKRLRPKQALKLMTAGLKLSREIPASAGGPHLSTLREALRLIDRDLPKERRHIPVWRRTRELLTKALRSKDPELIEEATDHLERALRAESGRS